MTAHFRRDFLARAAVHGHAVEMLLERTLFARREIEALAVLRERHAADFPLALRERAHVA